MDDITNKILFFTSAVQLAIKKHDAFKQTREDNITPYWTHPLRVVERLRFVGIDDYEVLSAAVMHDVIEDTDITQDDLTQNFSERVSQIVAEVSRLDGQSNEDYLKQLQEASTDGKAVKLADKWDNINELRRKQYMSYGNKPPLQYVEEGISTLAACSSGNQRLAKLLEDELALAKQAFSFV